MYVRNFGDRLIRAPQRMLKESMARRIAAIADRRGMTADDIAHIACYGGGFGRKSEKLIASFRKKPGVYWIGEAPTECDVSMKPITNTFIDGRMKRGSWAIMHPDVHADVGVGLGMGLGQKFTKQADGRWLKTEG